MTAPRHHPTAAPVHNRPLPVDGSDADEIGFSAPSVHKSGTPPVDKNHRGQLSELRDTEHTRLRSSKTLLPIGANRRIWSLEVSAPHLSLRLRRRSSQSSTRSAVVTSSTPVAR